ncbi:MAG: DUF1674 domain-containing protein [Pseudomonadota bacterium]
MTDSELPKMDVTGTQADASLASSSDDSNVVPLPAPRAPLSDVAKRALAEAEARRKASEEQAQQRAKEIGGRDGPDPVRYGDWENGGICWDF